MYCTYCGEKLDRLFVYCPQCGNETIKIDSKKNYDSHNENKEFSQDSTEIEKDKKLKSSLRFNKEKKIFDLKKVSKPIFFIVCFVFFYIGVYLTIIPNVPDFLFFLLLILVLYLNFYLISIYGHSLNTMFQMFSIVFSTAFFTTYINYDYTPEEYIDELLGIDGIVDDTLFYAIFITVINAICYFAILKLQKKIEEEVK